MASVKNSDQKHVWSIGAIAGRLEWLEGVSKLGGDEVRGIVYRGQHRSYRAGRAL